MRTLRELREQAGCSAAELARQAGVAPNTVLNAERGGTLERGKQRAITEALSMILQRKAFSQISDARYASIRADVELEAAQLHAQSMRVALEEAEAGQQESLERTRRDLEALWHELPEDSEAVA